MCVRIVQFVPFGVFHVQCTTLSMLSTAALRTWQREGERVLLTLLSFLDLPFNGPRSVYDYSTVKPFLPHLRWAFLVLLLSQEEIFVV